MIQLSYGAMRKEDILKFTLNVFIAIYNLII